MLVKAFMNRILIDNVRTNQNNTMFSTLIEIPHLFRASSI